MKKGQKVRLQTLRMGLPLAVFASLSISVTPTGLALTSDTGYRMPSPSDTQQYGSQGESRSYVENSSSHSFGGSQSGFTGGSSRWEGASGGNDSGFESTREFQRSRAAAQSMGGSASEQGSPADNSQGTTVGGESAQGVSGSSENVNANTGNGAEQSNPTGNTSTDSGTVQEGGSETGNTSENGNGTENAGGTENGNGTENAGGSENGTVQEGGSEQTGDNVETPSGNDTVGTSGFSLTATPSNNTAETNQDWTVSYDYNATRYSEVAQDGKPYAGVYTTTLTPNASGQASDSSSTGTTGKEAPAGATATTTTPETIGIPSVADQNLPDKPTTESPAIVVGAAVGYEEKTGAVEYKEMQPRDAPYTEFQHSVFHIVHKSEGGHRASPETEEAHEIVLACKRQPTRAKHIPQGFEIHPRIRLRGHKEIRSRLVIAQKQVLGCHLPLIMGDVCGKRLLTGEKGLVTMQAIRDACALKLVYDLMLPHHDASP